MINAIITFAIGIVIGGSVTYAYIKRRLGRQLTAKQHLIDQYQSDVSEIQIQHTAHVQALLTRYNKTIELEKEQRAQAEQKWNRLAQQETAWQEQNSSLVSENASLVRENSRLTQQKSETAEQLKLIRKTLESNQTAYREVLDTQEATFQQLEDSYKQQLKVQESDCAKLKAHCERLEVQHTQLGNDYAQCRQQAETSETQILEIMGKAEEQEKTLKGKITDLQNKIAMLQNEVTTEQQARGRDLRNFTLARDSACPDPEIDLDALIKQLFPNVKLLRDSLAEIRINKDHICAIFRQIQALSNGNSIHSNRIRGTDTWLECRVSKQGRVYYRRIRNNVEMLFSWKKDEKMQRQDINWLKDYAKQKS